MSVFITKARSATVIGYLILILSGLLAAQVIAPIITEADTPRGTIIGISIVPPFAFYRGLYALRLAVLTLLFRHLFFFNLLYFTLLILLCFPFFFMLSGYNKDIICGFYRLATL